MALIEASHHFKTADKEETQRAVAKQLQAVNKPYLEKSCSSTAKFLDRVPYTTREGMNIQLNQALKNSPDSKATVDDQINDSIARELEKEGFIDRVYGKKG